MGMTIKTKYSIGQKIFYITIDIEQNKLKIIESFINCIEIDKDNSINYIAPIEKNDPNKHISSIIFSTKEELFDTYGDAEFVVNIIDKHIKEKYNTLENFFNLKDIADVDKLKIIIDLVKQENRKLYKGINEDG